MSAVSEAGAERAELLCHHWSPLCPQDGLREGTPGSNGQVMPPEPIKPAAGV